MTLLIGVATGGLMVRRGAAGGGARVGGVAEAAGAAGRFLLVAGGALAC